MLRKVGGDHVVGTHCRDGRILLRLQPIQVRAYLILHSYNSRRTGVRSLHRQKRLCRNEYFMAARALVSAISSFWNRSGRASTTLSQLARRDASATCAHEGGMGGAALRGPGIA